jgi:putative ABC transport system permease protein
MGFLQDIKFGIRMLVKNPGFTLVAIVTLALGIGANSTVFTLVNAVLIKGLPVKDPQEIVWIHSTDPARAALRPPISYPDFVDLRQDSHSFKELGAFSAAPMDLSDSQAAAERVAGASITANTFSLLGSRPAQGRDFTADDAKPGAAPVALIREGLWQTRYGGNRGIIGQTIRVNLKQHTVIGIMPEDQGFPTDTKVWVPLIPDDSRLKRDQRNLSVFGRLAIGVSLKQAQVEVQSIAGRLAQSYPATNKDVGGKVIYFTDMMTGGPIRTIFLALLGAVTFVLLIACANVANLLLSRAIGRTREISIRTALGASRWRVVRQLLIESVMLSFLGGILGLGLSVFGVRMFAEAVKENGPPYWLDFSMDYRVFAYFLAICVATGILFGLAPALQISKTNVNENLKEGGRGSTGGIRGRRLTSALLVGQIGLTLVLLVGAGLMIRSFLNLQNFNVGIQTGNMLTVGISVPPAKYSQTEDRLAFLDRLQERVRSVPGIEAMTVASNAPAGGGAPLALKLADRDIADSNGRAPLVSRVVIAPGYFQALRLTLARGREFNAADGGPGNEAVIVNQPFAAKYWPGADAIGKRIRLGADEKAAWITIIGVSPPVFQQNDLNNSTAFRTADVQPTVYVPYRHEPNAPLNILTRNRIQNETVTATLRNELRNLDSDLPLFNIRTVDEMLYQRSWPYRVFGSLFAIFAAIALVMSSVGIYAVTAYGVNQRSQEIGIRMALGAGKRDVLWLILRQVLKRITVGLAIGLVSALAVSRVLSSLLFDVAPTDPATFLSISVVLSAVTIIACLVPATRATLLDPASVLNR